MNASTRGGEGGSANEAGSLHRNGAAAYFAALGLAGRSVDGSPGKVPVRVALESNDSVDDIVVSFMDGSRWYAQAKRRAGLDRTLDDVARQWIDQPLEEGDAVVLVARELTGNLKIARDLLQRRAVDASCPASEPQQAALGRLIARLDKAEPGRGEALAAQARLLALEVEDSSDRDAQTAAAALEGIVVKVGDGDRAVDALRATMQRFAARRLATGIDQWLDALAAAGVAPIDATNGAPGSARHQQRLAIAQYRAHWSQHVDQLDVSYLVRDIGPLHVPELARSLEVEWDADTRGTRSSDSLLNMVRRNRWLVVEGLPGMGKSAAMRQLAASLSADGTAPLGILVDLRKVTNTVTGPGDMTVAAILHEAARSVPLVDHEVLRAALESEIRSGHTILLFDGLDETHELAGTVATGIHALLKELHEDCGVILTTRPSSLGSAQILGFPIVRLTSPRHLRRALDAILGALAAARTTEDVRETWLRERVAWLDASFSRESHVWSVPLLATLGVDRLAEQIPETSNAAVLLSHVVDDSVKRWEFARATGPRVGLDREMRAEMLTEGFTAIGHMLGETPAAAVADVEQAITGGLKEWRLSPRLTAVIARQVRHFWDDTVGIFVESDGVVSARSRLFTELGEARFALNLPPKDRIAWIRKALASDDKRVSVMIAGLGDNRVYDDLIECANRLPLDTEALRAATWLADEEFETSTMAENQVEDLIAVLSRFAQTGAVPLAPSEDGTLKGWLAASKKNALAAEPPGYSFALALALLAIPARLEPTRLEALDSLAMPEPHVSILRSLVELQPVPGAHPELSQDVLKLATAALGAAPSREREPAGHDPSGVFRVPSGPRLIPGLFRVAERAIPFLAQLDPEAPDRIYRIARSASTRDYASIGSRMRELGYTDPEPLNVFSSLASLFEGYEDRMGLGFLLRAWGVTGASELRDGSNEHWRLKSIADLVQSSGWAETGVGEFRAASRENVETVLLWSNAWVRAMGLDARAVTQQASEILNWDGQGHDPIEVVLAHSFELAARGPDYDGWDAVELERLIPALASSSPWISRTSLGFFVQERSPLIAEAISRVKGRYTRETLKCLSIAMLFNSENRVAETKRLLESEDLVAQVSAADFTRWMKDPELDSAREIAQASSDGTVRARSGADLETALGAQYWTCWFCGHRNVQAATSCRGGDCHVSRESTWGIDRR